jgi:hypothetical protein
MIIQDSKTPFCCSKIPWASKKISPKIIDSLGTRFQKGSQPWRKPLYRQVVKFQLLKVVKVLVTSLSSDTSAVHYHNTFLPLQMAATALRGLRVLSLRTSNCCVLTEDELPSTSTPSVTWRRSHHTWWVVTECNTAEIQGEDTRKRAKVVL